MCVMVNMYTCTWGTMTGELWPIESCAQRMELGETVTSVTTTSDEAHLNPLTFLLCLIEIAYPIDAFDFRLFPSNSCCMPMRYF
jgi:hypothetical protein